MYIKLHKSGAPAPQAADMRKTDVNWSNTERTERQATEPNKHITGKAHTYIVHHANNTSTEEAKSRTIQTNQRTAILSDMQERQAIGQDNGFRATQTYRINTIGQLQKYALIKKYDTIRIATLNVHGLKKLGERQVVEHWMLTKGIDILCLQETHINISHAENSKKAYGTLVDIIGLMNRTFLQLE